MMLQGRQQEISTNVECDKWYPRSLKRLGDVQGEAEETYHQKKHKNALENVIYERSVGRVSMSRGSPTCLKPGY